MSVHTRAKTTCTAEAAVDWISTSKSVPSQLPLPPVSAAVSTQLGRNIFTARESRNSCVAARSHPAGTSDQPCQEAAGVTGKLHGNFATPRKSFLEGYMHWCEILKRLDVHMLPVPSMTEA